MSEFFSVASSWDITVFAMLFPAVTDRHWAPNVARSLGYTKNVGNKAWQVFMVK